MASGPLGCGIFSSSPLCIVKTGTDCAEGTRLVLRPEPGQYAADPDNLLHSSQGERKSFYYLLTTESAMGKFWVTRAEPSRKCIASWVRLEYKDHWLHDAFLGVCLQALDGQMSINSNYNSHKLLVLLPPMHWTLSDGAFVTLRKVILPGLVENCWLL